MNRMNKYRGISKEHHGTDSKIMEMKLFQPKPLLVVIIVQLVELDGPMLHFPKLLVIHFIFLFVLMRLMMMMKLQFVLIRPKPRLQTVAITLYTSFMTHNVAHTDTAHKLQSRFLIGGSNNKNPQNVLVLLDLQCLFSYLIK